MVSIGAPAAIKWGGLFLCEGAPFFLVFSTLLYYFMGMDEEEEVVVPDVVDLGRLRDTAWMHFVDSEARRAFAEDIVIVKRHPVTGESLGSYRLLGNPEFAAMSTLSPSSPLPVMTRDEWTAVLCTGRCHRTRAKGAMSGARARCALGGAPLRSAVECTAEALQLHPQAEALAVCISERSHNNTAGVL